MVWGLYNIKGTGRQDMVTQVEEIRQRIENSRKSSLLAAEGVTLLGASKAQGVEVIEACIRAGVADFGENRVQEAQAKWPEIKRKYSQVRLHLIGPLQSNKAGEAVALFDIIQSVDREKLVDALVKEMRAQGRDLPCYVQVNTGAEEQKAGVRPEAAGAFIGYCRAAGLHVAGLMCVPPVGQHAAPHFALLAKMAAEHGISQLSMGMSDDFETAVRMGATCVRVGRALFGERLD